MKRKSLSIVIIVIMIIVTIIPPKANSSAQIDNADIISITHNNAYESTLSIGSEYQYQVINLEKACELNKRINFNSFGRYDMLVLEDTSTELVSKDAANLINRGAVLFLKETEMTHEEIADELQIEKSYISYAGNTYERLGVSIYSVDGIYVFNNIYYANKDSDKADINKINQDLYQNGLAAVAEAVSLSETAQMINKSTKALDSLNPYAMSSDNAYQDVISQETMLIYSGNQHVFTTSITQTQMPKGKKIFNGNSQMVWNTKALYNITAKGNVAVTSYTIKMHCNITNHNYIDHTPLFNTETSTSYGVSIGESPTFDSMWSFNPYGQEFFNYTENLNLRVQLWDVYCNSYIARLSRQAAPGLSATSSGGDGQRGTFSSLDFYGLKYDTGAWW